MLQLSSRAKLTSRRQCSLATDFGDTKYRNAEQRWMAPAIAAALHDATGVWFDELPLLPYHVVAKLRQHGIRAG